MSPQTLVVLLGLALCGGGYAEPPSAQQSAKALVDDQCEASGTRVPVSSAALLQTRTRIARADATNSEDGAQSSVVNASEVEVPAGVYNLIAVWPFSHAQGYLSCREDGYVDVFDTYHEATGPRQRWHLSPRHDFYNIKVTGGTNQGEEYLSCRPDGLVDLWWTDDGSGRQQWKLTPHLYGYYWITVSGGTHADKTYLSARYDDDKVELTSYGDTSGRKMWRLQRV